MRRMWATEEYPVEAIENDEGQRFYYVDVRKGLEVWVQGRVEL